MPVQIFKSENEIDNKYFIATFDLEGKKSLKNAAWEIATGQSVGNPHMRSVWETDELFENHCCKIIGDETELETQKRGIIRIAFPIENTNWKEDGITQLLVQVMGGQLDISDITYCRLLKLEFPQEVLSYFKGPKFGNSGMRQYVGIGDDKPLLGAIVKPKTGITPQTLLSMVKELVEGGVNFIKEDEILSNPHFCPIEERVPLIMNYIRESGKKVVYCVCINADGAHVLDRVKKVYELGGNGVHINFWNGLGIYKSVRELDLPIFVHFQKSGDKILTDKQHRFSIDFEVICQLAGMMGVDTMHCGMLGIGGAYSDTSEDELLSIMKMLQTHNVVPALSCGMHPGIVNAITKRVGPNYLANSGGAVNSHPGGSKAGASAMIQAINHEFDKEEYKIAIAKWGLIE